MRLVVDTNIIISSLISNSVRRSILLNSGYEFISPEYTYTEIINHIDLIEKKAKITSKELQYVMDILFSNIKIYPKEEYSEYYSEAKKIMSDIDPDDAPFLALAIKAQVDGIWSEDKGFLKQDIIRIYTTKDLVELISL